MFDEGEVIAYIVIKLCMHCKTPQEQLLGCTHRNNGADSSSYPCSFASQSPSEDRGVRINLLAIIAKLILSYSKKPPFSKHMLTKHSNVLAYGRCIYGYSGFN